MSLSSSQERNTGTLAIETNKPQLLKEAQEKHSLYEHSARGPLGNQRRPLGSTLGWNAHQDYPEVWAELDPTYLSPGLLGGPLEDVVTGEV